MAHVQRLHAPGGTARPAGAFRSSPGRTPAGTREPARENGPAAVAEAAALLLPGRFVRIAEVAARSGLSRATLYRKAAQGTFPTPVRISSNASGWREDELARWLADPMGWSC